MRMITSISWFLLLVVLLLLAPSPSFQRDHAHKGKLPPLSPPSIKSTEPMSSVSKRGGGHGGGGHGGGGHGHSGGGGGRGGEIPLYAAGAAGAGSHRHHNGALRDYGKPMGNLGIALGVALLAIGFKHFV